MIMASGGVFSRRFCAIHAAAVFQKNIARGEIMPTYKAPLDDMRFVLNDVLGVSSLARVPGFQAVDDATTAQFLAEVAKLAEDVLFPLNASGDREGCLHHRDTRSVTTPKGFKEAYRQFCEAGLPGFACDPAYGGLGMPAVLNTALSEMFCSANMAFGMYPGLSHGAYNALYAYGTPEQKEKYLPKLVSGAWTGTMCLTEPQCGTDLGLIKTKAAPQGDGSYKITGTKIFISAGEHDLAENIIHLVLAKIDAPDTPAGIRGISLFVVPKFTDGNRNGVYCGRIEEKMGIHANSTCEMTFEAADGWLVGEAHKGMRAMFVMMNEARLGVGLQGLGISEVAYQNAVSYAQDRRQGQPIDRKADSAADDAPSVAIIAHPDVRRELLTMRAQTEGARMLAYWTALQLDLSQKSPDAGAKKKARALLDFLTPVVKAHMTDNAADHANAAMQVFGGHGYIREHGMEQYARDARITRIYEGTNGIQALDLVGRKVLKENLLPGYLAALKADLRAAKAAGVPAGLTAPLSRAAGRLKRATLRLRFRIIRETIKDKTGLGGDPGAVLRDAAGMATDYLHLCSLVVIGHMWLKMAAAAAARLGESDLQGRDFYETKMQTAAFYMRRILPQAEALAETLKDGADVLMATPADRFAHTQSNIAETTRPLMREEKKAS
jgi:alkylation response protein AidB-like acyl-CoA dehydrogenase